MLPWVFVVRGGKSAKSAPERKRKLRLMPSVAVLLVVVLLVVLEASLAFNY